MAPSLLLRLPSSASATSIAQFQQTNITKPRKFETQVRCIGWDPEGVLGPPRGGYIARLEFKRRLEKDAEAREAFELWRYTAYSYCTSPVSYLQTSKCKDTIGGVMDAGDEAATPTTHPAVEPLSFLLGTWKGQGQGGFPTITPFQYFEEVTFSHHPSKPVIAYSQKTWKLKDSGEPQHPMHGESGYWRPKLDGTIEVVIAQSTGLVEVQKGTFDATGKIVKLKSELIGNATKVTEINREFKVVNDELTYAVEMATNVTSQQTHLKASLKKL